MPTSTVCLVDDHTVVRKSLKELVECLGDYEVTMDFSSGKDLVAAIPFAAPPSIIILDVDMPGMTGIEVMKYFKENNITYPVLALTFDTTEDTIASLFRLGVKGYLPKKCEPEELKKALDDITTTGYYLTETMLNALAKDDKKTTNKQEEILDQLTPREKDFLALVCHTDEYTYEQIADIMQVHRRTVDGYRKALFEKYDIKSKAGLILFAIKHNLLEALNDG